MLLCCIHAYTHAQVNSHVSKYFNIKKAVASYANVDRVADKCLHVKVRINGKDTLLPTLFNPEAVGAYLDESHNGIRQHFTATDICRDLVSAEKPNDSSNFAKQQRALTVAQYFASIELAYSSVDNTFYTKSGRNAESAGLTHSKPSDVLRYKIIPYLVASRLECKRRVAGGDFTPTVVQYINVTGLSDPTIEFILPHYEAELTEYNNTKKITTQPEIIKQSSGSYTHVNGYFRKDGTYVRSYIRHNR